MYSCSLHPYLGQSTNELKRFGRPADEVTLRFVNGLNDEDYLSQLTNFSLLCFSLIAPEVGTTLSTRIFSVLSQDYFIIIHYVKQFFSRLIICIHVVRDASNRTTSALLVFLIGCVYDKNGYSFISLSVYRWIENIYETILHNIPFPGPGRLVTLLFITLRFF